MEKLEKVIRVTGEQFRDVYLEIKLLKIAVLILFIACLVLAGCVRGVYKQQQEMLQTPTMGKEIQVIWGFTAKPVDELEEIPVENLK